MVSQQGAGVAAGNGAGTVAGMQAETELDCSIKGVGGSGLGVGNVGNVLLVMLAMLLFVACCAVLGFCTVCVCVCVCFGFCLFGF